MHAKLRDDMQAVGLMIYSLATDDMQDTVLMICTCAASDDIHAVA